MTTTMMMTTDADSAEGASLAAKRARLSDRLRRLSPNERHALAVALRDPSPTNLVIALIESYIELRTSIAEVDDEIDVLDERVHDLGG